MLFTEKQVVLAAVKAQLKYLIRIKERIQKQLENSPEGSLATHYSKGYPQYYYRSKKGSQKYLSKKDYPLVKLLSQKRYNLQVKKQAERDIVLLNSFLSSYSQGSIAALAQEIPEDKAGFVSAIIDSDEVFARKWASEAFPPYPVDNPRHFSNSGLPLRSKSEVFIANALEKAGLLFRYEAPLRLKNSLVIRPDFCILNPYTRKVVYWEHFGMIDQADYREKMLKKLRDYAANGIFPGENLIITMESGASPLTTLEVDQVIGHYFRAA